MAERTRPAPGPTTYVLRVLVITYLVLLVIWPVSLVVTNTFANGDEALRSILEDPDLVDALRLTAVAAVVATAINTVFGVTVSLLLVRTVFPGKRILSAIENDNRATAAAIATLLLVISLLVIVVLDVVQRRVARRG